MSDLTKEEEFVQEVCPHCGQSTTSAYTVSRGLRNSLRSMARFIEKKGINIAHMQKELVALGYVTPNQAANLWTHGVYTGLIAHADEPCNYVITTKGFDFLAGGAVPKHAFVSKRTDNKNTKVISHSVETCTASDLDKKGECWEVLNYEVTEGKVITKTKYGGVYFSESLHNIQVLEEELNNREGKGTQHLTEY